VRRRPARRLVPGAPGVITVEFPLRGEWRAPHTPGEKVPSHGVTIWAQAYAYDLWRTHGARPGTFHRRSNLRYWTRGVELDDCDGFGARVHAAFAGTVVRACDDLVDRHRLHPLIDLLRVVRNGVTFARDAEPWPMIGNHVVVRHREIHRCYALYAHLRHASVPVAAGEEVDAGAVLGAVGHTGNSTAPHLHFQLMTDPDPRVAQPLPCVFAIYETWDAGRWTVATGDVPDKGQLIRSRSCA
jgi:Peptidase family M23